jgi:hypothetical protein
MSTLRIVTRLAVAAVASFALMAPAANASAAAATPSADGGVGILQAPVGKQCGAYRDNPFDTAHLRYWHCGPTWITIEVDKRTRDNTTMCVGPWEDVFVDYYIFSSHAWYVGGC